MWRQRNLAAESVPGVLLRRNQAEESMSDETKFETRPAAAGATCKQDRTIDHWHWRPCGKPAAEELECQRGAHREWVPMCKVHLAAERRKHQNALAWDAEWKRKAAQRKEEDKRAAAFVAKWGLECEIADGKITVDVDALERLMDALHKENAGGEA